MPDETLLITGRDIAKAVRMDLAIDIVEGVYAAHARGKVEMPPKMYIDLKRYHGDFRAMPAYVSGVEACGIKWVSVHPSNRRRGLPSVMALIILNDPATGAPLAVMDGTHITSIRTGAAGGVAAKHLAKKESSSVALFGCGVQARYQLDALACIFRIKTLTAFDRDTARSRAIASYARRLGIRSRVAATVRDCVSGSDIVVTTTPSRRPRIMADWISPGTHVNAIGADAKGKEELDPELLSLAKVVVDDVDQAMHSGEINVPVSKKLFRAADIHGTIGDVITGRACGRTSRGEITVFDSTGLAIQDMAVAHHIYTKLRKAGNIRRIRFR